MAIMQSKLARYHEPLAREIDKLINECRVLGATEGAQRLELICDQYNQLSPNTAYLWADPSAFQQEIEEAQSHTFWMEAVHIARNFFSLAPLIATWAALFMAVSSYQKYIIDHSNNKTISFLELWQSGFNGTTIFTFTTAAGIDVILLTIYLIFVLLTHDMERRAHLRAINFVRKLQAKIDEIIKCIMADTVHIGDQSDIERVINGIKQVVSAATTTMMQIADKMESNNLQAMSNLEQAMKLVVSDAQRAIEQTTNISVKATTDSNSRVESLFKNQVTPMMTTFGDDMKTLQKELGNYQGRLNDLTNASQLVANASQQLATASSSLTANADSYVAIGQDISTQISSLNTTQSEVLVQIETMASGITVATGNMTTVTTDMENALKMVADVSKQLDDGMRKTMDTMTSSVQDATEALAQVGPRLDQSSRYLSQVITNLSSTLAQVGPQLDQTCGQLSQAIMNLSSVRSKRPSFIKRITRNLRGLSGV